MSRASSYFQRNFDSVTVKNDLHSHDTKRQMSAVRLVIAYMIVGKDMSSHYTDIAKLISSPNLEMKKLVYLYLIQNSKSQPEKAVLQAASFVHDTNHQSPIIRGIALRTMSSMMVPAMVDYLHKPILARLKDSDPYVRRTAAFAALKLYTIAPDVCQQPGILDVLQEHLSSPVASVVAAAVCAIVELLNSSNCPVSLATAVAAKTMSLLSALGECSEWSQLYLLEGVAMLFRQRLPVITEEDAETVATRVQPLMQSGNSAVVMAAVKIIVMFLIQFIGNASPLSTAGKAVIEKKYTCKIVPPMITLLCSSTFEIRFVALRNIRLLLQLTSQSIQCSNVGVAVSFTDVFIPHMATFFLKFDDPIYIKLEKIDIMIMLATINNASRVLSELEEYASEIDVEVVRKAIRSIGILAVKLELVAAQCVEKLVTLIDTSINYIIQECAIVLQIILRQYPSKFVGVIPKLCKALDVLDDPESKAAVAWIIGEYSDRIENAAGVLNLFLVGYRDEPLNVQLSILTAVAKMYVKKVESVPGANQKAFQKILEMCTTSEEPDLRDRAFFYWRLTTTDPDIARKILLCPKTGIKPLNFISDNNLLVELVGKVGTVASVAHRSPTAIFGNETESRREVYYDDADNGITPTTCYVDPTSNITSVNGGGDVCDAHKQRVASQSVNVSVTGDGRHLNPPRINTNRMCWAHVLEGCGQGKGLDVYQCWSSGPKGPLLNTKLSLDSNVTTSTVVKPVVMQLNINAFGLGIGQEFPKNISVTDQRSSPTIISLEIAPNNKKNDSRDIQVALKVDPLGTLFFIAPAVPFSLLLNPAAGYDVQRYAAEYKNPDVQEGWTLPSDSPPILSNPDRLSANSLKVMSINLIHIKETSEKNHIGLHLFANTITGHRFYAAITFENYKLCAASVKSNDPGLASLFAEYLIGVVGE